MRNIKRVMYLLLLLTVSVIVIGCNKPVIGNFHIQIEREAVEKIEIIEIIGDEIQVLKELPLDSGIIDELGMLKVERRVDEQYQVKDGISLRISYGEGYYEIIQREGSYLFKRDEGRYSFDKEELLAVLYKYLKE